MDLVDNCIQNFHLGRWYKRRGKTKFLTVYRRYTPRSKWKFEYGYPYSNAFLQLCLKLERSKTHNASRYQKYVTKLISSNYCRQYIAANTVTKLQFWRYLIRRPFTKSSLLEYHLVALLS